MRRIGQLWWYNVVSSKSKFEQSDRHAPLRVTPFMSTDTDTPLRLIKGGLSDDSSGAAQQQAQHGDEEAFSVRDRDQVAMPRLLRLRQEAGVADTGGVAAGAPDQAGSDVAQSSSQESTDETSSAPRQREFPFALVQGEPVTHIPDDLYIPPAALEVFLEAFEGPLDLLLYLIKRQNLDILEIDVAELTEQYMQYVRLMDSMQFELAAEYLVMAAMLAEIKSRMLLPRSQDIDEDDEDPRAQLIRRLQEYERYKKVAEDINEMPREERDIFVVDVKPPADDRPRPEPDVDLKELLVALGDVLHRADMFESHAVSLEPLSTRERMGNILDLLSSSKTNSRANSQSDSSGDNFVPFLAFFKPEEGRGGVVVTFLAIMELIKESMIEIVQSEPFAPIHVRARISEATDAASEESLAEEAEETES